LTPVVIDSSAAVEILLRTPSGTALEAAVPRGAVEWAAEIYFSEVAGVLRRAEINDLITAERAAVAVDLLLAAPVNRVQVKPLLSEAWTMRQHTVPDAIYVALARHLRAPLVTADLRLARAPGPESEDQVELNHIVTPPRFRQSAHCADLGYRGRLTERRERIREFRDTVPDDCSPGIAASCALRGDWPLLAIRPGKLTVRGRGPSRRVFVESIAGPHMVTAELAHVHITVGIVIQPTQSDGWLFRNRERTDG
jgi:predicted nucleic acid-binding protein